MYLDVPSVYRPTFQSGWSCEVAPALSQAEEFLLHISQATTNGYSAHLNEVKPEATILPETNIAPKNDGFQ